MNLDLKDFFTNYNYFKNGNGFKDLENDIKELEQSKYNINGFNANERVQTSLKHNDRIENINLKIEKIKIEINKNRQIEQGVDLYFKGNWRKDFDLLLEFYLKYDGKKEKYKKHKGINGWEFRREFDRAIDTVIVALKSMLGHIAVILDLKLSELGIKD